MREAYECSYLWQVGGGVNVIVVAALVTCYAPRQRVRITGQVGRRVGGFAVFDRDKGLPGPFVAILVFDRQQVVGAPECLPVVRRRGLLRSFV